VVARQIETKRADNTWANQTFDYNTGLVLSLTNGMIEGTADGQYVGTHIRPAGLIIRAQYTRSDTSQLIRVIMIQNKAGGVPLLSTLLSSVNNVTAPLSNYDVDYNDTYRVLFDRLVSMDSIRGTTGTMIIRIPMKKLQRITFGNATGLLEKGGIYLCAISDSVTATAHPVLDIRASLYYKDA